MKGLTGRIAQAPIHPLKEPLALAYFIADQYKTLALQVQAAGS